MMAVYLSEVSASDYWEIMTAFYDEEFAVCGRPESEEEGHDHAGTDYEWVAPLVVYE